jgi:hypothetical protein
MKEIQESKTKIFKEGLELIEEGGLLGGLQMVEKASELGSVKASAFLGFGFYVGRDGLPKDYVLARKYLEVFVSQASPGNPDYADAHCFLGCIYAFGEGVRKDTKKALSHFKESAEHGNSIAAYYHNKITDKRDDRYLKWLVMPLIFSVIFGFAALSVFCGLNQTLSGILSTVIVIAIVLVYIFSAKKTWLDIPEEFLEDLQ